MTAGNNGASTPEDDDPFGYLYADGQARRSPAARRGGYGYPAPVNRARPVGAQYVVQPAVRTVGDRAVRRRSRSSRYGQPQQAHGQPNAHYAAPETLPRRRSPPASPTQHQAASGGGGGRGGGPNTKGLLIGADRGGRRGRDRHRRGHAGQRRRRQGRRRRQPGADSAPDRPSASPSDEPSAASAESRAELPKQDAAALRSAAGATLATDVKGAQGARAAPM